MRSDIYGKRADEMPITAALHDDHGDPWITLRLGKFTDQVTLYLTAAQAREIVSAIEIELREIESHCEFAGCDEPIKCKVEIEPYADAVRTTHMFCTEHSSLRAILPTFTNAPYSVSIIQL